MKILIEVLQRLGGSLLRIGAQVWARLGDYLSLVLENLDAPSRDTGCLYGARCHYRDGQPSPSFAAVDTAHPGDPLGAGVRFAI